MKRFPYFALVILIITMLACAVPGASPEPKATAIPSDPPEPTSTPLPTDTATPHPTATPDAAATSAVRATQGADDALTELDGLLGDTDIPYKDGHLAWQQDASINIKLTGPDYQKAEIDENLTAGNFILKSDVTWEATGILICGAVFRSEPNIEDGKQYQFMYLRLSGLPAWAIEVHEFGSYKNSPTGSKTSGALDLRNGATNQFVLVVQDDNFTIYLNGVRQGRYFDYSKQRTDGSFGFLGLQDSGNGLCEFENSWVWSLD
ncbi:MAG TPA: hypothetical protein DCX53_13665 [Anaerolineae bacterium]|nr:hypothetical protein [Anaerolineae bacterium]